MSKKLYYAYALCKLDGNNIIIYITLPCQGFMAQTLSSLSRLSMNPSCEKLNNVFALLLSNRTT